MTDDFKMKLLLGLFVYHCLLAVGIQAQGIPDFSAGIAELRALLGVAANVVLVPILTSSGETPPNPTANTVTSNNTLVRFELRVNSWLVYDAGVTAEFFANGSYASLWTSHGAEINVTDNGVPRILSRRALFILAQRFNLCQQVKSFQIKDLSLLYLMDRDTKVGRLIYRTSVVYYGHVTSLGNETTETIQPTALIDANTGEVIMSWNGFTAQSATTTAIQAFGGNIGAVLGMRTYTALVVGRLANGLCVYSTPDVEVQDMKGTTDGSFVATVFDCNAPKNADYDNANGGFSPLNDAMNNAQITVNMYRAWVKGISDLPFSLPVRLRVHFGISYSNSFWDETYANFGDGNQSTFYPMTTLDNVAHELGHAFTSYKSKLEYFGEPGGINEAFSDISGQAAVFFSNRTVTWKPGAEYNKSGGALRYMNNPPADGRSIDKYSAFSKLMDPHYSSGLYNKAFYLLVGRNDVWTMANTFQVFAYANRMHWRQLTNFTEGVCGVQNATRYLLGSSSVGDVKWAFSTVGLQC